jgi:hypothetical protein
MNRTLAALGLVLFLAPAAAAQQPLAFRVGDAMKGHVRSVRSEQAGFTRQDGVLVEGPRRLVALRSYSRDGRRVETESYMPDGSLRQKDVKLYDDQGNLVEETYYKGDGSLRNRNIYVHRPDELLTYDGDGTLLKRVVTTWNPTRDRAIEVRTYDGRGELLKRAVNTRDADGRSTWRTYNADGSPADQSTHSRDGGTVSSRESGFTQRGSLAVRREAKSEQTADGMRIEATEFNPDGSVRRRTLDVRENDSRGNIIKQTNLSWNEATGEFEPFAVSYHVITYY